MAKPTVLKHMVKAIAKDLGGPSRENMSRAFAIATATLQKHGYMKKGTQELTKKGEELEKKHKKHGGVEEYEAMLKKARKSESAQRVIDGLSQLLESTDLSDTQEKALVAALDFVIKEYEEEKEHWGKEAADKRLKGGIGFAWDFLKDQVPGLRRDSMKKLEKAGYIEHESTRKHKRETRPMWGRANRRVTMNYTKMYILTKKGFREAMRLKKSGV